MERIYLDWNATAPLSAEVHEAIVASLAMYGNASSVHHEGQRSRSIVERARRSVARAVCSEPQGVVFTGGATEANNQVLRAFERVAVSAVEHPSVLEVADLLQHEVLPVDRLGRIDVAAAVAAVERGANIVSVMLANNETGNLYPIAELAAAVHEAGGLMHTDATQAFGRIPIDFAALGVDFLTLSFHKSGGPKGVGSIVTREGIKVAPLLAGGHQERGRRPGTENVVGVAGVDALAARVAAGVPTAALEAKRELFLTALADARPELRGDQEHRLPNTVNVAFAAVDGEDLLLALDLAGIAASSGSACTAGSLEPSHVILAMGYEELDARRSVRFSFGPTTPEQALLEAARTIVETVARLAEL